ncbi:MAG: MarR family winged helix-turn-helix transcriptional regulator [Fusobacteriaceae bacterium]
MLANQVKSEGILKNFITLNNLIQKEINDILKDSPINYLEYSILMYSSQNTVTQYRISKEYDISPQRINQFINNLEKHNFIDKEDDKVNGRAAKKILVTRAGKKILKEVNNEIVERIEEKQILPETLKALNANLKLVITGLSK